MSNNQTTFENNGEIIRMQSELEGNLLAIWALSVFILFSIITINNSNLKSPRIKKIVMYGLLTVSILVLILGITKYTYEFYTRILPSDYLIQPDNITIRPLEKVNVIFYIILTIILIGIQLAYTIHISNS